MVRPQCSGKKAGGVKQDPLSPEASRRHLRAILLKVHPDHFSAHKAQQDSNSEALKHLNAYVDHVAEGKQVVAFTLSFFIKGELPGSFKEVTVAMPGTGSLAPLFHAFGLISDADLLKAEAGGADNDGQRRQTMRDLLAWLSQHMAEISRAQQEYAKHQAKLQDLTGAIQTKFKLTIAILCHTWGDRVAALQRQMVQLKALESALLKLKGAGVSFHGLNVWLRDSTDWVFAGGRRSHIDPVNGRVYVLAGSDTLHQELASLDPDRARSLATSSSNFDQMVSGLLAQAAALLGVHSVCFGETIQPEHKSVVWVQRLLKDRKIIQKAMASCKTQRLSSITILIESHAHPQPNGSPCIPTWLYVSNSSSSKDLITFLGSDDGSAAAARAHASRMSDEADEALRTRVRQALGCRHVATVIGLTSRSRSTWRQAAQLLLDNSRLLRSSVDLSTIMLMLGDKYEIVAELGMITIPCDFEAKDLPRQLLLLMAPGAQLQPPGLLAAAGGKRKRKACEGALAVCPKSPAPALGPVLRKRARR